MGTKYRCKRGTCAYSNGTSFSVWNPVVELNVHRANASARGFYERVGFAESGTTSGGDVLVMRRRR